MFVVSFFLDIVCFIVLLSFTAHQHSRGHIARKIQLKVVSTISVRSPFSRRLREANVALVLLTMGTVNTNDRCPTLTYNIVYI